MAHAALTTPSNIAKARASDRLSRAIVDLDAQGLRHHCADPSIGWLWISEDPKDRAQVRPWSRNSRICGVEAA